MSHVAQLALLRGALWAILLYFAIRHRSWPSIIVVALAWTANTFIALGLTVESGLIGIASVSLLVVLLIDRLDKSPQHLKHVATAQVSDARRELHDCQQDRAAWEARAIAYRRLLEKHNIHH